MSSIVDLARAYLAKAVDGTMDERDAAADALGDALFAKSTDNDNAVVVKAPEGWHMAPAMSGWLSLHVERTLNSWGEPRFSVRTVEIAEVPDLAIRNGVPEVILNTLRDTGATLMGQAEYLRTIEVRRTSPIAGQLATMAVKLQARAEAIASLLSRFDPN